MKIFLTGATGFAGHHVARELTSRGTQLRLLVRRSSNLANLEGIPAKTHICDLDDPSSIPPGARRLRRPHARSRRLPPLDPRPGRHALRQVDGTRDLLRLAREAKVRRVVYTSSVATMGFRSDGLIVNEDTPVHLEMMIGHYKRSKFLAEQEAIRAAEAGQQVMILNPTTPIGSHDAKPTPTGPLRGGPVAPICHRVDCRRRKGAAVEKHTRKRQSAHGSAKPRMG